MANIIYLSPSKLNVLKDCPRCFWLENNQDSKIPRPRGIFSSMPGSFDLILKTRYDYYRSDGLVPEITGQIYGTLYQNQKDIDEYRNWRKSPQYIDVENGYALRGALDDLLLEKSNNAASPFDYKTKGSEPTKEDTIKYYQLQMDLQALMLKQSHALSGVAYLAYYYPVEIHSHKDLFSMGLKFPFSCKVIQIEARADRGLEFFNKAIELLKSEIPPCSPFCEYCKYTELRKQRCIGQYR